MHVLDVYRFFTCLRMAILSCCFMAKKNEMKVGIIFVITK